MSRPKGHPSFRTSDPTRLWDRVLVGDGPDHLFLGTQGDNIKDMITKGRNVSAEALKAHCANGHAYDEANTYRNPRTGKRTCRTCHRETERRRREARKCA